MNLFFDTQYILMLEKTKYWEYFPQKLAAGDFKTEFWEYIPKKLAAGDFKKNIENIFPRNWQQETSRQTQERSSTISLALPTRWLSTKSWWRSLSLSSPVSTRGTGNNSATAKMELFLESNCSYRKRHCVDLLTILQKYSFSTNRGKAYILNPFSTHRSNAYILDLSFWFLELKVQ